MTVRLAQSGRWSGGQLLPLKHAGRSGRQLATLAQGWSELERPDRMTGLYQTVGVEKCRAPSEACAKAESSGFDALRPRALIFDSSPWGSTASLAIAKGCQGPYLVLEADELAGPLAVLTALNDLARERCDQALVAGSVYGEERAWLLLLERRSDARLVWRASFTFGLSEPPREALSAAAARWGQAPRVLRGDPVEDPHGLWATREALVLASQGVPASVFCATSDTRGLWLLFGEGT